MNFGIPFFSLPPDDSLLYAGIYNPWWVAISILLAMLSCYAALRSTARVGQLSNSLSRLTWVLIGGLTMGVGVWAMHFIGMLALNLPCRVQYDPVITLVSIVPGMLTGGLAMGIGWNRVPLLRPLSGSVLVGAGIATMHYTGMAAMRLEGFVRYDPALFGLSIAGAIVLAFAALRVQASQIRLVGHQRDALIAAILGLAVSSAHYIGMSSAYFVHGSAASLPATDFSTNTLSAVIAVTTAFLALGVLTLAGISRNREITDQLAKLLAERTDERDLLEQRVLERTEEIRHLVYFDPLTDLPNRRMFREHLEKTLDANVPTNCKGALMFIDMDNFKSLNDTLGHGIGDLLLKAVSQRLLECVREKDLVARLGGDEFVITLVDLDENVDLASRQADKVGQKILAALNQLYDLDGHSHCSTSSIGVTIFSDRKNSIGELLKQADNAMYQAKTAGRNTLRFFDQKLQRVAAVHRLTKTTLGRKHHFTI